MSDNYMDDDLNDQDSFDEQDPNDIKSLRRAANSKKKIEQELLQAKRELAFAKAGIDPDDPRMRYFVKGYEGELTPAAVRQAATEAGFISAPVDSGSDQAQQVAVQQAQERVMTASAGAVIEDASEAAAYARLEQAMEEGGVPAMLEVARQYGIPIATEM